MNRIKAFLLLFSVLLTLVPSPTQVEAAFNPHDLLSDAELTDTRAMTLAEIARFLGRGTLGTYETQDIDTRTRSAAEIVWNAAQRFGINPRFLLVLLQREQSLVEDPSPTQDQFDWAMGYAICDDCSKDDPDLQKYRGFAPQVHYAAKRIRESYLTDLRLVGSTISGVGPGLSTVIDGVEVIPTNAATAVLYTYTPHLHGNENFVRIWQRWFDGCFSCWS